MTASAGRGISEGVAVVIASVVMAGGLAGVMLWQGRQAAEAPGPEGEADTAALAAMTEDRDRLSASLVTAESQVAVLEDEVGRLKAELREAEAKRLEAKAASELAVESVRNEVRELEAERDDLVRQVEEIGSRAEALEAQVGVLSDATVEAATATPAPMLPPASGSVSDGVSEKVLAGLRIEEAEKNLNYVVLGAGKIDGVRAGMIFNVMDGNEVTAQLRAIDVRETLTGAAVDDVRSDRFPEPGDRVILRQVADN